MFDTRPAEKALVTGAAGFIGAAVSRALLERGLSVVGIDNLNPYYDPALKRARLKLLSGFARFSFHELDIADPEALPALAAARDVDRVVHLAAQAGVRYSLERPFAYALSNVIGQLSVLEFVRKSPNAPLLIYASSSSVYGANTKTPFAESDRVDHPMSVYAATKRSAELLSESYARLYGLAQIGLRFFTVYGPWGRPDMAYWSFTEKIIAGEPIQVFNRGDLKRDFTYIDDIVAGVVATILDPMKPGEGPPHRIYNIGNNRAVGLLRFIEVLEEAIGKKAKTVLQPMQPGDVYETCADINAISADYGFRPTTPLEEGIPRFVSWYRGWRKGTGRG